MDPDQPTGPQRGDFVVYHGTQTCYDGWVMKVEAITTGPDGVRLSLESSGYHLLGVRVESVLPDTPAAWGTPSGS